MVQPVVDHVAPGSFDDCIFTFQSLKLFILFAGPIFLSKHCVEITEHLRSVGSRALCLFSFANLDCALNVASSDARMGLSSQSQRVVREYSERLIKLSLRGVQSSRVHEFVTELNMTPCNAFAIVGISRFNRNVHRLNRTLRIAVQ